MIISQFTPVYTPQNLDNAPIQVLTQFRHCVYSVLEMKTTKLDNRIKIEVL